ncbi:hypothetical protein CVIRNUC_002203 [Coccomyxa viridis]|uniref:Uncharacterized protein n=1 Tax=Coccomyxa viridis TaxID=1274662 RepID=A0AAV1HWN4_9CHLO|nr:hypothetical protein CVIRNUC_002203 [Coccomyxa viridis]
MSHHVPRQPWDVKGHQSGSFTSQAVVRAGPTLSAGSLDPTVDRPAHYTFPPEAAAPGPAPPGHAPMQPAGRGAGTDDEVVCSEMLRIESKIFFCDAKANARGLYLKISEKGTNRERSTIIVPGQSLPWFRELFNYYASTEPSLATAKEFPVESKVFYWSVGDNPRGRYLRISESGAGPRGRSSIIVPSGGADCSAWLAFRSVLARIESRTMNRPPLELQLERLSDLESHLASLGAMHGMAQTSDYLGALSLSGGPLQIPSMGQETIVGPGPAPPSLSTSDTGSHIVRAGHKRYFFDLGSNNKGQYLRITEVAGQDRIAIIVPAEALPQFYRAVGLCLEESHAGTGPSSSQRPHG